MRVAVIVPGGIAATGRGIQSPPLRMFISALSEILDVTVYSLRYSVADPERDRCGKASIVNVQASPSDPFVEQLLAMRRALVEDHSQRPYKVLHGFWALPCGLLAIFLGSMLGIPSAVTLLGGETADVRKIGYGNMQRVHSRWATLWVCRNAGSLMVLTNFQALQLRSRGVYRHIHVIPFGVDIRRFRQRSTRIPRPPYRILHVGNLTEVKGQHLLLRTFAELRKQADATLTVVGPDYLRGSLQRLSGTLGLNGSVRFTGRKEYEAIPAEYRQADILLHTPYHEAQGMVIAEACASGVPPVGTPVGLMADLRLLFPSLVHGENETELVQGMVRLLTRANAYGSLQRSLRGWAVQHDSRWTVNEYVRAYSALTARQ